MGDRVLIIGLVVLLLGAAGLEVVPEDGSLSIERYRELGIDEATRKASQGEPDSQYARELMERQQATRPQLRDDLEVVLIVSLAGMIEVGEKSATRPSTRFLLRDELVELVPRAIQHLSDHRSAALRDAIRVLASHEENETIRTELVDSTTKAE